MKFVNWFLDQKWNENTHDIHIRLPVTAIGLAVLLFVMHFLFPVPHTYGAFGGTLLAGIGLFLLIACLQDRRARRRGEKIQW